MDDDSKRDDGTHDALILALEVHVEGCSHLDWEGTPGESNGRESGPAKVSTRAYRIHSPVADAVTL